MAWWVPGLNWGSGITRGGWCWGGGLAQSVASTEGGTQHSGSFSSFSSADLGGEAEGPPNTCPGCRVLGRDEAGQAVTGRLALAVPVASRCSPATSSSIKWEQDEMLPHRRVFCYEAPCFSRRKNQEI